MATTKYSQKPTRLLLGTPHPKATISLGKPRRTFGYTGISAQSDEHLFVNIEKKSLLQLKGGVAQVSHGSLETLADGPFSISTANTGNLASKGVMWITAGVGHSQAMEGVTGDTPSLGNFERDKTNQIIIPMSKSIREFDLKFAEDQEELKEALGYSIIEDLDIEEEKPDPTPKGRLARLKRSLKGLAGSITKTFESTVAFRDRHRVRLLQGAPDQIRAGTVDEPTRYSGDIEQLLVRSEGILGIAKKVLKALDTLEKLPDATAAKVVAKLAQVEGHLDKATRYINKGGDVLTKHVPKWGGVIDSAHDHFDKAARAKGYRLEDFDPEADKGKSAEERQAAIDARRESREKEEKAHEARDKEETDRKKVRDDAEKPADEEKKKRQKETEAKQAALKKQKDSTDLAPLVFVRDTSHLATEPIIDFLGVAPTVTEHLKMGTQHLKAATSIVVDVINVVLWFVGKDGPPGPGGVVALAATEGISMVTPSRVFANAGNGFHFVSSAPSEKPDWYQKKQQSITEKIAQTAGKLPKVGGYLHDKILPEEEEPTHAPGFFVSTNGNVEMSSEEEIALSTTGRASIVRLRSRCAVEVGAATAIGINARTGPVAIAGATVTLGVPDIKSARELAKNAGPNDASMRKDIEDANKDYEKAIQEQLATALKLDKLKLDLAFILENIRITKKHMDPTVYEPSPKLISKLADLEERRRVRLTQIGILQKDCAKQKEGVRKCLEARDEKIEILREEQQDVLGPAAAKSNELAALFGYDALNQVYTESIQAAAVNHISLFGGEQILAESKELKLTAIDPDEDPKTAAVMRLEKDVTIAVGDYSVTVSGDGVRITHKDSGSISLGPKGISIDADSSALVLKSPDLKLDAKMFSLEASQIKLG